MSQAIPMGTHCLCRRAGLGGAAPQPGEVLGVLGCLQGISRAREVSSQVDVSWGLDFPWPPAQTTGFSLCPAQHDGQPYCHKPCYGILFGPKGECLGHVGWGPSPGTRALRGLPLSVLMPPPRGDISLEHATFLPVSSPSCFLPHAGVNTGAVGSYIYDKDPEAKNQP